MWLFFPPEVLFFSDHGSQQVEVEEGEEEEAPWSVTPGDYWTPYCSTQELLLLLDPLEIWKFFVLFFGSVECVEAGNMSSGRLSHLLRGVWLLCLWQGESSRAPV